MEVDIEVLLADWLPDQDAIYDATGGRIYCETIPAKPTWPLLRFSLVGGALSPNVDAVWLDKPRIQFDAYGGTKGEARAIAGAVRSALFSLRGTHEAGVVTGVTIDSMRSLPDVGYEPPRARYIVTATVMVHPTP